RRVDAGDAVEERRLTGAVGPDQRKDLAPANCKGDVVDRHQAAELLGDLADLQDVAVHGHGGHPWAPSSPRAELSFAARSTPISARLGIRPPGLNSMVVTRIKPKSRNLSRDTNSPSPGQSPVGWSIAVKPVVASRLCTWLGASGRILKRIR